MNANTNVVTLRSYREGIDHLRTKYGHELVEGDIRYMARSVYLNGEEEEYVAAVLKAQRKPLLL